MGDVLTYDDIVNSYEFKLTEKILKREFPWIKRIDIRPEELEKYKIIFLDIYFDPYEFAREKDWLINWYKVGELHRGESLRESYLTIFFNVSYDESREVTSEIEETINAVKESNAIPRDLKLPSSRTFSIGSWVSEPNLTIPPDAEEYEQKYSRT